MGVGRTVSSMRALVLEHLHSNPVGIYGDVLADRGVDVEAITAGLPVLRRLSRVAAPRVLDGGTGLQGGGAPSWA